MTPEGVRGSLGIEEDRLTQLIDAATEQEALVRDLDEAGSFCEYRNYESLLRILRRRNREASVTLPASELVPFLRVHQEGFLTETQAHLPEAILSSFEGYSAPVDLWETEILPRLLGDLHPGALEALFRSRELHWVGTGRRRITLVGPEGLELIRDEAEGPGEGGLFPDSQGWYAFGDLIGRNAGGPDAAPRDRDQTAKRLWALAWNGRATADSFEVVSRGQPADRESGTAGRRPGRRSSGGRQVSGAQRLSGPRGPSVARRPGGFRGMHTVLPAPLWRSLPDAQTLFAEYDAYDFEELRRDRARLLLDRYGVVFREMLLPELPALSWGRLFRTLRVMELSGEVVGGIFFSGVPGIQFARPEVAEKLAEWSGAGGPGGTGGENRRPAGLLRLNAMDPISLCGRGIKELGYELPPRVPGTTLLYDGPTLLAIARRGGSEVSFFADPGNGRLSEVVEALKTPATRRIRRVTRLIIRRINGDEAARSPFARAFHDAGFVTDREELVFWAKYL